MNYRNIQLPSSKILEWGKQGENKATRLSVDVSEFIKLSEGTIAVSCCRPDGKKYPHDCTINDTTVEIELNSYDTQVCGILTIVVSWMCGERIVKSETYCGEISRSISTSGEKPTPPFDGLIEQVCNAAIKAKESADRAEAAADRAAETVSAAREAAVDARASKQACGEILESVQSTVAEAGSVQVQAVKDKGAEAMDSVAAVGAEQVSAVQSASDNSKTAIERKTDEQLARIPEVTAIAADVSSLKYDIGNKLPKSPTDWEAWTDAEKAVAREKIGVDGGGSNQGIEVEKITVNSLSDKVVNGLVCYRVGGFHVISGWFRFNAQPTNGEFLFAIEGISIKSASTPITCIEENGSQHVSLWVRADGLIKYSSNAEKNLNSAFIANGAVI